MRHAILLFALLVAACLDTPVDTTGVATMGKPPVINQVLGVTMRYDAVDVTVGETVQLGFVPRLANNTGAFYPQSMLWRSSAPEVATVDPNGLVSAVRPGQAFVTVTVDGHVGQTAVTVLAAPPPG
ncbi:MAG: Ig-like domain-containing protein [Gemmatimonadaceae bacterium]|nr:Ig-like domain-containing protein [Gemmatimonadaceae bacterium]